MPIDDFPPDPLEWRNLSAPNTRLCLAMELYGLTHWDEDIQFSKYKKQFIDYWHFFFDDFVFKDNPSCMVGQSLFQDELPYVARFIKVFEPFANAVTTDLIYGPIDKSKIILPNEIVDAASQLYDKLLEKGNPNIAQFRR